MDLNGPIINFKSENGRIYRNGDHKNLDDKIIVELSDPLGINLTKELGHSIILRNLYTNEKFDITEKFIYDFNSITTGSINIDRYLRGSEMNYSVNAWDNANNPSEKEIKLISIEDNKVQLFNIFNFPNPFTEKTKFTFELSSNANVSISIYTIGGKRIKSLQTKYFEPGFHSIDWDGKNEYGKMLSSGMYLYKIIAKDTKTKTQHIGKIAIYR